MIIHFILLLLALALFIFSLDKRNFRITTFVLFCLFIVLSFILVSFRSEMVGNDTAGYVQFFHISGYYDSLHALLNDTRFEPGYVFLNYIVSRLSADYTIFFLTYNLINFVCTVYFFRKYCFNKNAWPILWLIWATFYWSFSAIRASMAVCLVYMFFDAVLQNKIKKAILWLLIAGSFHSSALVAGICLIVKLPVFREVKKHPFLLVIVFLCLGAALGQLISLLPDYYSGYYTNSAYAEGGMRIASLMDFLMLSFCYIVTRPSYNSIEEWQYAIEFNLFFLLAIGFSFLGLLFNPFNRVEMFFIPMAIVYMVNSCRYISQLKKMGLILGSCIVGTYQIVAFLIRPEWLSIFPYSFR